MTLPRSTSLRQFRPFRLGPRLQPLLGPPVPPNISSEAASFPAACWLAATASLPCLEKVGMGRGSIAPDDLTLGQPVALKFLPDEARAIKLCGSVSKTKCGFARRVSHPNVLPRSTTWATSKATHFSPWEYVDGEDLASLLAPHRTPARRQGPSTSHASSAPDWLRHMPKACSIATLKPANIMLDGRGQVVITDFGLAGLADQIQGAEVRSGTPA